MSWIKGCTLSVWCSTPQTGPVQWLREVCVTVPYFIPTWTAVWKQLVEFQPALFWLSLVFCGVFVWLCLLYRTSKCRKEQTVNLCVEDESGGRCYMFQTVLIMIIIITFKGAIRDFLQSPHSAANCLRHVHSSGPGATVCKSCATHRALVTCKCHVTCHLVSWYEGTAQLLSLTELKSHLFEFLFYWLNH